MKKRIVALFLSVLILGSSIFAPFNTVASTASDVVSADAYWPVGPEVQSESAIVMEVSTGTILYEKNIHEVLYPASITKIMTTLLAIENNKLSETVTFSKEAVYSIDGTHIARDVGEQMSLEDTLYAVMLGSANECAYATAEHVAGGDYNAFVNMMNERAAELGCLNTHFNNAHGLPDENHYTTAYDMAVISRAAIQNETFRTITGTKKYTIPPTNKHTDETPLVNHHAMLNFYKTGRYIYPYCIGGKTGYTNAAQYTLVTYAEKDGMTLVCVVMKAPAEVHYQDTISLLDFCFNNFQLYNVEENEVRYTGEELNNTANFMEDLSYFELDKSAGVVLPKTAVLEDAVAHIQYDSEEGTAALVYEYAGREVGRANLTTKDSFTDIFKFGNSGSKQENEKKKLIELNWKIIAFVVFMLAVLAGLVYLIYYLRKNIYVMMYHIRQKKKERRNALHFKERKKRRQRRAQLLKKARK